jgi:hypothetical protein
MNAFNLIIILVVIKQVNIGANMVPHFWKLSHITPIFKDGNRRNIKNYRCVAIISQFPKLFENIIYDQNFHEVCAQIISQQHIFFLGDLYPQILCPLLDGGWISGGRSVHRFQQSF